MRGRKLGSKGKTPSMVHISIFVPKEVVDYFKTQNKRYTKPMRDVLIAHVSKSPT
jgi:hypothetical protein